MITRHNIMKHELIGMEMNVISSHDPTHNGLRGTIIDETRNTFMVFTKKGEKRLAKGGLVFRVPLDGREVDIHGNKIMFRPEDRPKKVK